MNWLVKRLQHVAGDKEFFDSLDKTLSSFGEMVTSSEHCYRRSSTQYSDCQDYVVINEDYIVGAYGKLILEPKLIHGGCRAAHIEDLCVNPDFRGQGLSTLLLKHMLEFTDYDGSYKVMLNCTPELQEFYEKQGFKKTNNIQMEVR